jgi:RNA polymerase sigma-70 factor (ECF subfamily)
VGSRSRSAGGFDPTGPAGPSQPEPLARSLDVSGYATSLALSPMNIGAPRPGNPSLRAAPAEPSFEEEFRICYRQRFASLFTYLDRLTGDAEMASDVAQEAFVRLHGRGAMPNQPGGWLVAVANNLVRDEQRRATRQLRILARNPERAPSGSAVMNPGEKLERDERVQAVRGALERLSPRDRKALLLRHAGYSYREIAAALHLASGSVGTTLVRAGQMFRAAFKEMHGAPD